MTSWEYKVIKTDKKFWSGLDRIDIEQILNDLGRDGWELISVIPLSQQGAGLTTGLQFFLKRKRF